MLLNGSEDCFLESSLCDEPVPLQRFTGMYERSLIDSPFPKSIKKKLSVHNFWTPQQLCQDTAWSGKDTCSKEAKKPAVK